MLWLLTLNALKKLGRVLKCDNFRWKTLPLISHEAAIYSSSATAQPGSRRSSCQVNKDLTSFRTHSNIHGENITVCTGIFMTGCQKTRILKIFLKMCFTSIHGPVYTKNSFILAQLTIEVLLYRLKNKSTKTTPARATGTSPNKRFDWAIHHQFLFHTIAVHGRYNAFTFRSSFSAKQQREMTKFWATVVCRNDW